MMGGRDEQAAAVGMAWWNSLPEIERVRMETADGGWSEEALRAFEAVAAAERAFERALLAAADPENCFGDYEDRLHRGGA